LVDSEFSSARIGREVVDIPFLGGGSLLRSSTLPPNAGVMVALGGTPVELIVATDVCLEFIQLTLEPEFLFRVCEKVVLRIKEPTAIATIWFT
jgi:hypothetical protein